MVNQYTKEHGNSFTYNSVTSSSTISCKMLRICASIIHIISYNHLTQYQHNCTYNEWFMPRWNCNRSPWQITHIRVHDNALIFLLPYKMKCLAEISKEKKEKEDIQCMELISQPLMFPRAWVNFFKILSHEWNKFYIQRQNIEFSVKYIFFGFWTCFSFKL